jgi:membrane-bound metal-dependent hydrolase YbcI (DUF457 family)
VSWVAHDIEPYVIQRELGDKVTISFLAVLIGSWGPDLLTKWLVYGVNVFGLHLKADDPVQFHRGWPGVGFTHSLTFAAALAGVVYLVTKSKGWALGLLIGLWAHTLTDAGDTVGTMLFFPWTHQFSVGAWAYAGQNGRNLDAAAYYSGLGGMWDLLWLILGLLCWRVLTRDYFHARIVPADSFWPWAGRWLPEDALLAVYRGAFFFGACRWITWMIWAHVVHHYPFDLSWGGPHWVPTAHS